FFGYQPKLRNAFRVDFLLVTKSNRFKRKNRFAGISHRLDIVLKPRGRGQCAELAICIDKDSDAASGRFASNSGDITAEHKVRVSDAYGPALACYAVSSSRAEIDVIVATDEILSHLCADHRVISAVYLTDHRGVTNSNICRAIDVA